MNNPLTPKTDMYALGFTLFELLAGSPPFGYEPSIYSLTRMILYDPPLALRTANPSLTIPDCAEAIIMKALAKKPKDRFPSMTDMLRAIEECD